MLHSIQNAYTVLDRYIKSCTDLEHIKISNSLIEAFRARFQKNALLHECLHQLAASLQERHVLIQCRLLDKITPYLLFRLNDGTEVHVDKYGFATYWGYKSMPLEPGRHPLQDGFNLDVGNSGKLLLF